MPLTIKNRWTEAPIATVEDTDDLREAVIRLVKQGVDLSSASLGGANLTLASLDGANLTRANLARASLDGANLARANLYGANLTRANLARANLALANLDGANLTRANLDGANLTRANLDGANLDGARFGAIEKLIKVQSLHRRILGAIEAGGTLDMATWHRCDTTHCRAGWAIHLAGPAGEMLEACVGPSVAGALIHLVNCHALEGRVPDFSADNDDALADIKRLAELEEPLEAIA